MKRSLSARLEKGLVALLAVSFAIPGLLGLCLLLPGTKTRATALLRNRTLSGIQLKPTTVPPSRSNVLSARYQATLAEFYNVNFVGREVAIRVLNEGYLRVFHASTDDEIIGRNLNIFEPAYAEEYCLRRGDDHALRALVADLKRMQDFCRERGTAFAVVITPSKAAVYPENLPEKWRQRYRPAPRYYDLFIPLLKSAGIRYVDSHCLAEEMKGQARVPLFPAGGIHWGQPLALATTNDLLSLLDGQGLPGQPIQHYQAHESTRPEGQDADLAGLLNLLLPLRYPVTTLTLQPVAAPERGRPNLVIVGGSFVATMLEMLDASRQFSEIEYYFYYKGFKSCQLNGERHTISSPTGPINFETEIFAADALVLEMNEQVLYAPAKHVTDFLRDALAVLPDPHTPKAPFHYESRLEYRWGDTLSFVRDDHPINLAATTGLSSPNAAGSYSVGPLATVHLIVTAPDQDMTLEVAASAYHIDRATPEQTVEVSVNDHPVGRWNWRSTETSTRKLTIPKQFLPAGELVLQFRIAHTVSPSDLGQGRDARQLGIHLSRIRMYPTDQ